MKISDNNNTLSRPRADILNVLQKTRANVVVRDALDLALCMDFGDGLTLWRERAATLWKWLLLLRRDLLYDTQFITDISLFMSMGATVISEVSESIFSYKHTHILR